MAFQLVIERAHRRSSGRKVHGNWVSVHVRVLEWMQELVQAQERVKAQELVQRRVTKPVVVQDSELAVGWMQSSCQPDACEGDVHPTHPH